MVKVIGGIPARPRRQLMFRYLDHSRFEFDSLWISNISGNMDFARIVEAACVTSPQRVILCRRFYLVVYLSSDTFVNMMDTFCEGPCILNGEISLAVLLIMVTFCEQTLSLIFVLIASPNKRTGSFILSMKSLTISRSRVKGRPVQISAYALSKCFW